MCKAPILSAPKFDREFHVIGDASGFCLGIILWQFLINECLNTIFTALMSSSKQEGHQRRLEDTQRVAVMISTIKRCKRVKK